MQNKLKKSGYKITKPRLAILEELKKSHKLMSAKMLFNKIKNVNLTSVYRTLDILEETGLVFKESIKGEHFYYVAAKQHHHIICDKCGYSKCVPCKEKSIKVSGFTKINHQLLLKGICQKCA